MSSRIYRGIGGFYTVKTEAGELVECKPRGIFRKRGMKPLAGDEVSLAEEAGTLYIDEIHPRKNSFIRPPVANVDTLFIIASTAEPVPSTLVMDKLTAVAVEQECEPVILVTKGDLEDPAPLLACYARTEFTAFEVNVEKQLGLERVRAMLSGKLSVFCGNSGVGKSTLLNALLGQQTRETGEISKKLGRGRHTTREVELYEVGGGLVADTPGFASLDMQATAEISADNMQFAFPEIACLMPSCKFSGCSHLVEKGCAVRAALEEGKISQSRYDSYTALYHEAKENPRY